MEFWANVCCLFILFKVASSMTSQCYNEPSDVIITREQPLLLHCLQPDSCSDITSADVTSQTVTWMKDGDVIPFNNIFGRRSLLGNGSLLVREPVNRVGASDSGFYSCHVKHDSVIFQSRVAHVVVGVLGSFTKQPKSVSCTAGATVRLACKPSNAEPKPVISWFRNNSFIGNNSIMTSQANNTIVLPNDELEVCATMDDVGEYYCVASNIARVRKSSKVRLTLYKDDTQANISPIFVRKPKNRSVIMGSRVYMDCLGEGEPNPVMTWYKDEIKLDFKSQSNIVRVGIGGLLIRNASSLHSGSYTCVATNINGRSNTTAMLVVSDTYIISTTTITAFPDQVISTPCNRTPSTSHHVTSLVNGLTLQSTSSIENQISSLATHNTLQCYANFDGSFQQRRIQLDILNKDTIYKKLLETRLNATQQSNDLQIHEAELGAFNITWNHTNDETKFKVFVFDAKLLTLRSIGTSDTWATFDADPNHLIIVCVFTYTHVGVGEYNMTTSFIAPISVHTNITFDDCSSCEISGLSTMATTTSITTTWNPCSTRHKLCPFQLIFIQPTRKTYTTRNTTITTRGLNKFTEHTLKVCVVGGRCSQQIQTTTIQSVPDLPPPNITVVAETSSSAMIRWSQLPQNHINGILSGYKIRIRNKVNHETAFHEIPATEVQFLVTGLLRNTEYLMQMQAFTGAGGGPPSQKYSFRTPKRDRPESTPPGKPLSLSAQRSSTAITVQWRPPVENMFVRYYVIDWGKRAPHEASRTVDNKHRYYKISNLESSTQYFISVRAGNNVGLGSKSLIKVRTKSAEADIEDLYPPLALNIDVLTPTTMNVSWLDSQATGKVSHYYIIKYKTHVPSEPRVRFLNSTTLYCVIHALRPYTMYEVTVRTVSGRRRSSWSMTESAITKQSKPTTPPTDLTVMDLNELTSVQLNWQPPDQPNGELNGYLVFYTTDPRHDIANWVIEPVVGDKLSTVIKGLTLDTQYYIKVLARNTIGVGPYSEIIEYKTKSTPHDVKESTWVMPTWMLYVIIGGVALLVISVVAIATLVVCRNRNVDRTKYKNRKTNGVRPPSGRNDGDGWSRNGSNIMTSAPLLHHDDIIELQSLRAGQCKCDHARTPSEIISINNGINCNHVIRDNGRNNSHYMYNGRGTPKFARTVSPSYQDCTGDSAYSSDPPIIHYNNDVRDHSSSKLSDCDVRRGIPQTEYSCRNSLTNSMISDETNSDLADVEDFVRGMKTSCSSDLT
uniref:neogenin isoform X2 n=1 Tax=Ciona intestinalis TaxID=7719 RepID=UPI000EF54041|nr:neogenin isoform X2 [Ciona intestinalis]|eukprot:XP_026694247.1 neogenin isoform X2 [Ciona intestinalis]